MRLLLCSVVLAYALAACGGKSATMQATGMFTCPSPPIPAEAVTSCQSRYARVNRLTLTVPQRGGSVTGDGAIDGALGGANDPAQPDPATCIHGLQWVIKVTGTYDESSHTITGTFSEDTTPTAGTCLSALGHAAHYDRPFRATLDGNKITGEAAILFFEATLR
jgi:hypothetical protein